MKTRTKIRIANCFARSLGWLTRRSGLARILTFHSVQEGGDPLVHQPPELFEEQIRYLAEQGYRSYRVCDVVESWPAILDGPKFTVITFDDGLSNGRTVACPILQRYGMTATFFITTACVSDDRRPPGVEGMHNVRDVDMLSWQDLREMADEGFEIGAHSHTHVRISRQSPRRAREEIFLPKAMLEQELGRPICSFAYPKGRADSFAPWTRDLLAEAGYKAGYTQMGRPLRRGCDLLNLSRTSIHGLDTLASFRMKLSGNYDLLRRIRGQ